MAGQERQPDFAKLKSLIESPAWPEYEFFLEDLKQSKVKLMLQADKHDLDAARAAVNAVDEVRRLLPQRVKEFEEKQKDFARR